MLVCCGYSVFDLSIFGLGLVLRMVRRWRSWIFGGFGLVILGIYKYRGVFKFLFNFLKNYVF